MRIIHLFIELIAIILIGILLSVIGCAFILSVYYILKLIVSYITAFFIVLFIGYIVFYILSRIGEHLNK